MRVNGRQRRPTATSRFGVSRRENHDASEFYERFITPTISADDTIAPPAVRDEIWVGNARSMDEFGDIADGSVALVVTSPPYYAGKEYETAIGEGHVPESYLAYLDMLEAVFRECVRKLEPGGRIAVNVANLGRKPYRSLSADVIRILEQLGLLLRGEVIWVKGRAAGGSCAWGSFQRPGNPVLRDVTERIVVASKGRFDRAVGARARSAAELPSVATVSADEFMDLTTDVWEFLPESARRVGHPAPFPVELPRRFIDLYTYEGDLVLDPFMGSGSTAVAAMRTGRHYVGFDTDPEYVAQAQARVEEEQQRLEAEVVRVRVHALPPAADDVADPEGLDHEVEARRRALVDGRKATDLARLVVEQAGFTEIDDRNVKVKGVSVSLRARDGAGRVWHFDVVGAFANGQAGLRRTETLWKTLGKASVLQAAAPDLRLILLTTDLPPSGSPAAHALEAWQGDSGSNLISDVIQLLDDDDLLRLRKHAGQDTAVVTTTTRPSAAAKG
jgi:site-specific DNA-methyltransferase (adenine-specific)